MLKSVYLSSKSADRYRSASTLSDVDYDLDLPLYSTTRAPLELRVNQVTIPNVFHNVYGSDLRFYKRTVSGGTITSTFPAGYYTWSTLISKLHTITSGLTFTFDELSGILKIASSESETTFISASEALSRVLGLPRSGELSIPILTVQSLPYAIDLLGPQCLLLCSRNLIVQSGSNDSNRLANRSVLQFIPVTVAYGGVITMPYAGEVCTLTNDSISSISLQLLDEDLNEVTLLSDWSVHLSFY